MRLRRTFLAVFGITIVVLAGGLLYAYQANEATVVERSQETLNRTAEELSTAIEKRLQDKLETLRMAAADPRISRWNTSVQARALEKILEHAEVGGVSVIAANGTMVAIRGVDVETRQRLVGQGFGHREYFQHAMDGEGYVSDPIDAESGNTIVTISVPIRRDGRIVGTLNAAFHLTEAHFFRDSLTFYDESANRRVVVTAGPRRHTTTLYRSPGRIDGPTVARTAVVDSTGWTVTVRRSKATMLAPVRRYQTMVVGLAVVLFGMVAAAGAWTYRSNVKQIERLEEGLDALRAGDYDEEIDVGGSAEWESIDDTYEDLRAAIPTRERHLRRFREAVEQTGHAVYITDTDGEIVYVNPAFERMTGYSAEEAIGETPAILNSGTKEEEYYERLWATVQSGETWHEEIVNRRKSGELFFINQTIAPIFDDEGEIREFVAIQTDVSDRRERERQLRVLDRVLRHNVRNDMDVVLGHAERIHERGAGEVADSAEAILDSGSRLLETVDKEREIVDVLTTSRSTRRTNLAETALRSVREMREEFPEAAVSITAPESVTVTAVEELGLAVRELVRNAVVHSDRETPEVSVAVEVGDSTAELTVRDDGPGIPEQVREVLTADREIDQLFHGSGLGLWLVNWIVRRSDGRLQFHERDPRGSVVTVTLPLSDPDGQ